MTNSHKRSTRSFSPQTNFPERAGLCFVEDFSEDTNKATGCLLQRGDKSISHLDRSLTVPEVILSGICAFKELCMQGNCRAGAEKRENCGNINSLGTFSSDAPSVRQM